MKKLFKKGSNQKHKLTFEITFTGIFLALVFVFSFISKVIPPILADFLKLDLGLIFLIPIFAIIRWRFGFIALLLSFIFTPIFTGSADISGYLGHFILLVSRSIFIFVIMLFLYDRKARFSTWQWIGIYLIAIVVVSLVITILNILIFTPLYFYVFKISNSASFVELANKWKGFAWFGFGIKNYYLANLALYIPFNFISFTLVSILVMPLIKICFKILKLIHIQ